MAHKASSIYYLVLYRKGLLTPDLIALRSDVKTDLDTETESRESEGFARHGSRVMEAELVEGAQVSGLLSSAPHPSHSPTLPFLL